MSAQPNDAGELRPNDNSVENSQEKALTFADLPLQREILVTLAHLKYNEPTPIQARAIPATLEGHDILGLAQTGTGKTAAFLLPILESLITNGRATSPAVPHSPQAVILAPTRELALQIAENMRAYSYKLNVRHSVVVGGVSYLRQKDELARGAHVVIATPGRLMDLMKQGAIRFNAVETFVLDEADRMLDIGFLPDIRRIVAALPQKRQTLFFSATMPHAVASLANDILNKPVRIEITPESTPVDRITQSVIMVPNPEKRQVLLDLMAKDGFERVIIFTRTKHGADKVAKMLETVGINTGAMHGRKSQAQRQNVLRAFSRGKIRALVATDVAARGIDVDDITHVINYELPNEPENYVHRIGRTARAGRAGIAIALCGGSLEKTYLRQIEKLTKQRIQIEDRPENSGVAAPALRQQDNEGTKKKAEQQDNFAEEDTSSERRGSRQHTRPDQQASTKKKHRKGPTRKDRDERDARVAKNARSSRSDDRLDAMMGFTTDASSPSNGEDTQARPAKYSRNTSRGEGRRDTRRNDSRQSDSRRSDSRPSDSRPSDSRRSDSRRSDSRRSDTRGDDRYKSNRDDQRDNRRGERQDNRQDYQSASGRPFKRKEAFNSDDRRPSSDDRRNRTNASSSPFSRDTRKAQGNRPIRQDRSERPQMAERSERPERSERSARPSRPMQQRGSAANGNHTPGARPFARRGSKQVKRG